MQIDKWNILRRSVGYYDVKASGSICRVFVNDWYCGDYEACFAVSYRRDYVYRYLCPLSNRGRGVSQSSVLPAWVSAHRAEGPGRPRWHWNGQLGLVYLLNMLLFVLYICFDWLQYLSSATTAIGGPLVTALDKEKPEAIPPARPLPPKDTVNFIHLDQRPLDLRT